MSIRLTLGILHGLTIDPKEDMVAICMAQLHPGAPQYGW
jgi:hypothetical protein